MKYNGDGSVVNERALYSRISTRFESGRRPISFVAMPATDLLHNFAPYDNDTAIQTQIFAVKRDAGTNE